MMASPKGQLTSYPLTCGNSWKKKKIALKFQKKDEKLSHAVSSGRVLAFEFQCVNL